MSKQRIKQLIDERLSNDGTVETGVKGVQLFRVSEPTRCAPAVYEPTVVAIVNGAKEAILDGKKYVYDGSQYMCCAMSMPVEAGTPTASPDNPLLGVYISLDTRVMTELAIEMESAAGAIRKPRGGALPEGLTFANWDDTFSDALLRLLLVTGNPVDAAVLGNSRLREVYYAILKGDAGDSARRAFGVGNEIARAIEYVSSRLDESVTIDALAAQVGMSRAVFHRKFKQATTLSPIQFVKAMRLNTAAMKIAQGMNVNEAAMRVGYVSSSQFSREFKRTYGQSPRQWSYSKQEFMGAQ
ncbi:HTH-type transcriptional activator RhaS [Zhongshania aliphaticivorans]|uniref:HTH-type transcriptional activator RhaS n=1 Tax=Zhongshania aliphaticivorans TaxID=1470434 RepID=A0A5S9N1I3_9GAMM|nr:AraC family transcriptional regulator [Zhongshania aliphaticivorans]CAA0083096.1 HTH-type transcriptional activator RhaS [Zhongshania aliphaticivorans]CAA0083706.1 HTH-type transcriptional activator RhaS [Zhongshania aliphaticivorans]